MDPTSVRERDLQLWRAVPLDRCKFERVAPTSFREIESAYLARLRASRATRAYFGADWAERAKIRTRIVPVTDEAMLIRAEVECPRPRRTSVPPIFVSLFVIGEPGLVAAPGRPYVRRVFVFAYEAGDPELAARITRYAAQSLLKFGPTTVTADGELVPLLLSELRCEGRAGR